VFDEIEIEWIPEDTGTSYEINMLEPMYDLPGHTIDKICKKKFGHTNWARMSSLTPDELHNNPCEIDYDEGIVYFKYPRMV
jgi:hypothetical protein